jgi:hypothetical protein
MDINYNNEILLNNNTIIFKNDKIIFNEETDVIIINTLNYNIYKPYFENITDTSIIIYDGINKINEEKINSKNNIYIIGDYIIGDYIIDKNFTLNTNKKVFYIPTEIEKMLNCYNINSDTNIIIDINFINKFIENNDDAYIKNIFAKSLLLSIIAGNNTYLYFKKSFEEKKYIEIIKLSLQISKIIENIDKEDNIYNDHITNSIIISSNNKIPYDIAKLYDVLITYKIFYDNKISGINDYIHDYIPYIYKNIKISENDFIDNLVNENKLNFIFIEKAGNIKIMSRNLEDIKDYLKEGYRKYF